MRPVIARARARSDAALRRAGRALFRLGTNRLLKISGRGSGRKEKARKKEKEKEREEGEKTRHALRRIPYRCVRSPLRDALDASAIRFALLRLEDARANHRAFLCPAKYLLWFARSLSAANT